MDVFRFIMYTQKSPDSDWIRIKESVVFETSLVFITCRLSEMSIAGNYLSNIFWEFPLKWLATKKRQASQSVWGWWLLIKISVTYHYSLIYTSKICSLYLKNLPQSVSSKRNHQVVYHNSLFHPKRNYQVVGITRGIIRWSTTWWFLSDETDCNGKFLRYVMTFIILLCLCHWTLFCILQTLTHIWYIYLYMKYSCSISSAMKSIRNS